MRNQPPNVTAGLVDPNRVAATLEQHQREPTITPDQHIRRLMIDLGKSIAEKRKIYLDTRYWIFLRDAAMDRPKLPLHSSLLQRLRALVAEGIALCPISDVMFAELLKQSDSATRLATACVVDELSSGVALSMADQRVGTEFALFLHEFGASTEVHPIDHLVWTKHCFVWGEHYPSETPFSPEMERALQKAFIDHLWSMSLEQMVRMIGAAELPQKADFEETARRLNAGNRDHQHELRTFPQLVVAELAGVVDLYKERLADIVDEMHEQQVGSRRTLSPEERRGAESLLRNAIINLYRLRPALMAKRAPTLYVGAKCHAAVRWNRGKNLTANDLMDFHHAAAALGYCDAFFTDNPLKILLTQNHVQLPSELGRFITADDAEALRYVESLARDRSTAPSR